MTADQIRAAAYKRPDWRNPGKVNPFAMEAARPQKRGPETNLWFHSPSRYGVMFAPESFSRALREISEDLRVTWNFHAQRWMCWARSARIQNQYSQGWNLLFVHNGPDGGYLPLDERLLARIHTCDTQNTGGALRHFDRVMAEMERDKEKAKAKTSGENMDIAMESFDHAQIKVGYGKSNGSKFSTYHA